jgi:beta-lactamase regulating signal transducer with metallopeptidase domain
MLGWSAQTTVIAMVLAAIAILASRSARLGPAARHVLWLVVLIKLLTPPVVNWPWSPPALWATARPTLIAHSVADPQKVTALKDGAAQSDAASARPTASIPPASTPTRTIPPGAIAPGAIPASQMRVDFDLLGRGLFGVWLGISAVIAVWQIGRIVRFHRRLRWVIPAPEWLVQEVRDLSGQMGVRAPEILVLPDLAPPMLWFLGRAKLLVPARLVSNADLLGLRAILAHELAHLRRGDHWVRRLDFFAGLIWWWNPVYWLTRERLSTEAELACDEWAIRAVPDGRVSYAEALLEVCRTLSTTRSPAPALGVAGAGAGRFLERRVNMILQNHAPSRISMPVLLGAGLLALLALPGWSAAGSTVVKVSDLATLTSPQNENPVASAPDEKAKDEKATDENAKTDAADDDDKNAEAIKAQIAKELKKELGPGSEFEKEMKNLAEELKKELGPGSEFEKEMKNLAEDLKKQFGPGSDFEKQMRAKGKEIEGKYGPGSDFERKMKRLGKDMESRFGEGSEFAQKMKHFANDAQSDKTSSDNFFHKKIKTKADDPTDAATSSDNYFYKKIDSKADKKTSAKAREVRALKAQIDELNARLNKLQEAEGKEND